jgi:hypothetical protein
MFWGGKIFCWMMDFRCWMMENRQSTNPPAKFRAKYGGQVDLSCLLLCGNGKEVSGV